MTLYLLFIGIRGEWVGRFFWPAVVVHAVLTVFLARAWFEARRRRVAAGLEVIAAARNPGVV